MIFFKAESILKERQRRQTGRMLCSELGKVGWEQEGMRGTPQELEHMEWGRRCEQSCLGSTKGMLLCKQHLPVTFAFSRMISVEQTHNCKEEHKRNLQHNGFEQSFQSSSAVHVSNITCVPRKTFKHCSP